MIKKKDIVVCIILSLVTCGIYYLVWLANTVDDSNRVSGDNLLPSGGTVILLSIITCGIYEFYAYYQLGKMIQKSKQKTDPKAEDNSILYLILALFKFSIVSIALIQNELNLLTDANA